METKITFDDIDLQNNILLFLNKSKTGMLEDFIDNRFPQYSKKSIKAALDALKSYNLIAVRSEKDLHGDCTLIYQINNRGKKYLENNSIEYTDDTELIRNRLIEAQDLLIELRNTYLYNLNENGQPKASLVEIIELWNKVNQYLN